ncbi:transcriptional regulator, AraC family [Kribbella flavida DSM 17836]|uniref:Transcriptional regulator, AraC family n=1 Tax=Kribbella flavida (strain DSM 17836 / JCM 10339 / NBRC 14399) TaxID=479435 RepID=D2Q1P4_KRIFD|nr:helix-turn-helix domain-containing protein [Kribbella flavida]ADB32033.1 transcriptional regulator, AraC family [Kribbella flavida DSM 17836]
MSVRPARKHRVAVLALPGVVPFELAIAARIFGGAFAGDDPEQPLYDVVACTVDGSPVETSDGYAITVRYDASVLATADTVVVPPSHQLQEILDAAGALDDAVLRALEQIRPGARMLAICTGAFVLAAAGLLDGRRAATHWAEAERLQRVFPAVAVDPMVLFIDDGDVLTSAGAAAGIDLCLHVVRRDHGSAVASSVARACVVPPRRDGGQAQYVRRPVPPARDGGTAATRAWAAERLGRPLSLRELAAHAGMSVRTFTRRFRGETGVSPGSWLAMQRLDYARQLLEDTELTVDQVADRAGLGTGANLRQQLRETAGVSPSAYRRMFRSEVEPGVRTTPGVRQL